MTEPNDMSESDSSEEVKLPMALFAVEPKSNKRLLFDMSTRKIHGVSSSVFPNATCVFENGGWFLMVQHKPPDFKEQAVFLVHQSTGGRLDLPAFGSSSNGIFVFYVDSHGAPLVVACVKTRTSFAPTVHVACPGDVCWSVYKHGVDADPPPCSASRAAQRRRQRRLLEPASIVDVALVGTQAICLDANGEILVFDVTEMTWRRRTPAVRPDSGFEQYARSLVAADGEVLLVSRPRTMENAFRFFKLDVEALEWSPLERRKLDDTSWFLSKGQSFRARDAGKRRVYTFRVEGAGACTLGLGMSLKCITNVYAYDLDDGSVEMVIPASIVTEARRWVRPCVCAAPATSHDPVVY
ncbi:hypothetical protein C2845_PM09G23250 [Panicum miliaceum]|uniref:KIB1-4 beta-propeller domain-containing protein n=1 Tax=Panicum miliaceum TaxID=4540 RepID=A0A3L6S3B7_PANMI|nr:hypothetical protein C2845_PM09G23250 [Panicum miliaceum]